MPLVGVLLVVITGFTGALLWQNQEAQRERVRAALETVRLRFEDAQEGQARMLGALLETLARDPQLRAAMRARDSATLLTRFRPLFEDLRRQFGITHLYFLGPDRVTLLRVYAPERAGDLIRRFTAREAERTGGLVHGLEIGDFGTFTLRAVRPLVEQGELLGYLELGKEIEDLLASFADAGTVETAVALYKDVLNRADWEAGMAMLGRPAEWDRFGSSVLVHSSLPRFPSEFDRFVPEAGHVHRDPDQQARYGGRTWSVAVTPLFDATGAEVGDLLVMFDDSLLRAASARFVGFLLAVATLVLAVTLWFVYRILRRTDDGIRAGKAALELSEERLRLAINGVNDGIFDWDLLANTIYFSPKWKAMIGYADQELANGLDSFERHLHPDDRFRVLDAIQDYLAGKSPTYEVQFRFRHKDGSWRLVQARGEALRDEYGRALRLVGFHTDITERRQAENLRLVSSIFAASHEAIMITDAENRIIDVNQAFTEVTGYGREEARGRNPKMLSSGQEPAEFFKDMWRALVDRGGWRGEVWNRRKSGEPYPALLSITAVKADDGEVSHYVAVLADISHIKERERDLARGAYYDPLTGLPNRRLLADRLHQAIAQAHRSGDRVAVAYLDLDGFKTVNDSHGHLAGDSLLKEIARRLEVSVREGDTVARVGGDEFVLVLRFPLDSRDRGGLLSRLLEAIAAPVHLDRQTVTVTCSIGVAVFPADAADAEGLLRLADEAMYAAKQSGKNRFQFHDPAAGQG